MAFAPASPRFGTPVFLAALCCAFVRETASASPPVILFEPVEQRIFAGGRTELAVTAQCAAGDDCVLSYQWHRCGVPLPGATSRVLSFAHTLPADAGDYFVSVRGSAGETWSRTVTLHVSSDPAVPGTVDTSFSPALLANPSGGIRGTIYAIVPTTDGGWLAGGDFTFANGLPKAGLAKLTATGALDESFALSGLPTNPTVRCLAPVPGGWLVGGSAFTVKRPWLAFIPASGGSIVSAENRWSFTAVTGQEVRALLPLPDGRVLAAGTFTATAAGYSGARLIRLNTDRTLDPTLPAAGWNAGVLALAATSTGHVIAGGAFSTPSRCLTRLLPGGGVDASFTPPAAGWNAAAEVSALAVTTSGRIVAGGKFTFTPTGAEARYSLAGFATTGAADLSFLPRPNTDGKAEFRALVADASGGVVAGGKFTEISASVGEGLVSRSTWSGVVHLDSAGNPVLPQQPAAWDDRTVFSLASGSARWLAGGDFNWPARRLTALRATPPPVTAPAFTGPVTPHRALLRSGDRLFLHADATGWPAPAWQWYHNGTPIEGETSATLIRYGVTSEHAGSYIVTASNTAGTATSAPVSVSVHSRPPGPAPLASGILASPLEVPAYTKSLVALRPAGSFPVATATLAIQLKHKDTNDLTLTLIAPGGRRAVIFEQVSPTGRDFEHTLFDDASTLHLSDSLPPYHGTFQTGGALNTLRGINASGDWVLELDNTGGQKATLLAAHLMLEGAPDTDISYADWLTYAAPPAGLTLPQQDANGDGHSNAWEWLYGSAPCDPDNFTAGVRSLRTGPGGELLLDCCGWHSAPWRLEWSADLRNWLPATEGADFLTLWTTRLTPQRTTRTLRLTPPEATRYWRVRSGE